MRPLIRHAAAVGLCALLGGACTRPWSAEGDGHSALWRRSEGIPLGLLAPTFPTGHPPRAEEVALGHALFFDPVLSRDSTVSCASCHDPRHAFADPRPRSLGVGGARSRRNSPSLLNVALFDHFGWDGRHSSLEAQTLDAITRPEEMGLAAADLPGRVRPRYGELLRRAYGEVSAEAVAAAVASYQRTLLSGDSPFDRFLYRGERDAISESSRRGFEVFKRKGRCIQCHMVRCEECHPFGGNSAFFTNFRFHNLGVGFDSLGRANDLGRAEATRRPADAGAFKAPSLRNVALTAPYMHDGSLSTLEEVVDHYDRGGVANPHLDPEIRPLHLSEGEKSDLVAFLRSLTSTKLLTNSGTLSARP